MLGIDSGKHCTVRVQVFRRSQNSTPRSITGKPRWKFIIWTDLLLKNTNEHYMLLAYYIKQYSDSSSQFCLILKGGLKVIDCIVLSAKCRCCRCSNGNLAVGLHAASQHGHLGINLLTNTDNYG